MTTGNDVRGWIMTCVSGLACIFGASIICVDLVIQRIPAYKSFRIQDSNVFLASSLSLSFGVMLFLSLSHMYPEAQEYLHNGGLSDSNSKFVTIGCFLLGTIFIAILSRILHHHIPTEVVDCDHSHDGHDANETRQQSDTSILPAHLDILADTSESTCLIGGKTLDPLNSGPRRTYSATAQTLQRADATRLTGSMSRRASVQPRLITRVETFMTGAKVSCDDGGPCLGYTVPCGQECVKITNRTITRSLSRLPSTFSIRSNSASQPNTIPRSSPYRIAQATHDVEVAPSEDSSRHRVHGRGRSPSARHQETAQSDHVMPPIRPLTLPNTHTAIHSHQIVFSDGSSGDDGETTLDATHHHHVPHNAFLSIGLQTSMAIALHKLPEGFITYATNHANPTLGFNVFMALFVHNITEGFAMALPLYLALGSRWRAMLWAFLLGGASQPLGAAVAAVWFKIAGSTDMKPGDIFYGCMFAVTSGIMTSVALQLFTESLTLIHNRNICLVAAFVGMGVLGICQALTASAT